MLGNAEVQPRMDTDGHGFLNVAYEQKLEVQMYAPKLKIPNERVFCELELLRTPKQRFVACGSKCFWPDTGEWT